MYKATSNSYKATSNSGLTRADTDTESRCRLHQKAFSFFDLTSGIMILEGLGLGLDSAAGWQPNMNKPDPCQSVLAVLAVHDLPVRSGPLLQWLGKVTVTVPIQFTCRFSESQ